MTSTRRPSRRHNASATLLSIAFIAVVAPGDVSVRGQVDGEAGPWCGHVHHHAWS